MEKTIKIECRGCKKSYEVDRDNDAPVKAIKMACNWCPDCEDSANEYYKEWYLFKRRPYTKKKQLKLF